MRALSRPPAAPGASDLTAAQRVETLAAAALDQRLEFGCDRPVAVAVSGGGDSIALLHLASLWARQRRRNLLVLTVDHGLQPASGTWSSQVHQAALRLGAAWRGLEWRDPKPLRVTSADARRARHALIGEAARAAGARVVLVGHTLDDALEAELMREQGSGLGRLSAFTPSPAWPEGRGLMYLRPLLDLTRADLRAGLDVFGATWIEDPANSNPASARARARLALANGASAPPPCVSGPVGLAGALVCGAGRVRLPPEALCDNEGSRRLAILTACASGRSEAVLTGVERLKQALLTGNGAKQTLAGAAVQARADGVHIWRETGELRRRRSASTSQGGRSTPADVLDGRFARLQAGEGRLAPALGQMSRLSRSDRELLKGFLPELRAGLPVLIRDAESAPVLAWTSEPVLSLVAERLRAACGEITHEREVGARCMAPGDPLS